ncbi:MAG: hypothetical protein JWN44_6729 [Myxococcales bacterium]|nr:hypothetical protein [Myxococcales bacterium]
MDCTRVDEELVAFQLAALDGATRAAVEAHLTGCVRCVSAFLALKRAVDAAEDAVAPSEMVRARIRQSAEKQLTAHSSQLTGADRKRARPAIWVLAATAAALLLAAPFAWRMGRVPASRPGLTSGASDDGVAVPVVPARQTVDTARATPENLAFL